MHHKRGITIFAVIIAVAATLPAAAAAGKPVIFDHESFVDGPNPGSWCGVVDGTGVTTGTFTFRQDASGAFHATQQQTSVFTASATGKSLEVSAAGVDMGAGVDNGDGTMTFMEKTAGLGVAYKVPNGPILKDANGKPLLGAGVIDDVATFDIATGDLISFQETFNGPHPQRDGVDVCTPTIAYLTS
jgi:hypothetical protein